MKKLFVVAVAILLTATWSLADEWNPIPLEFGVEDYLMYNFDGSALNIPVTVTGKPAAIWLVIMTHDKGSEISHVSNGHMNWHYVNKIDTTVFISSRMSKEVGSTTVTWNGKNSDGDNVEAGTYEYYIWGFDDKTARELASCNTMVTHEFQVTLSKLWCYDPDHMPLANPVFFGNPPWYVQYDPCGMVYRWTLGHDPEDPEGREETKCPIYVTGADGNLPGFLQIGMPGFDKDDWNMFYQPCRDCDAALSTILKWQYVPDGEAVLQNDWGGWDSDLVFENPGAAASPSPWVAEQAVVSDFNYMYVNCSSGTNDINWNYIYCIDFDGELVFAKNMDDWYMPDDPYPGNGNPEHIDWSIKTPYRLVFLGDCCMIDCIDITNILEDVDDDEEMLLYRNGNGDFFQDCGFAPDADPAWFCREYSSMMSETGEAQGRKVNIQLDSNEFTLQGIAQYGLACFCVGTPDGTGIGYMNFADETVGDQTIRKGAGVVCDNGTKFDGYYLGRASNEAGNMWLWGTANVVGFDSKGGLISNEPAPSVEADAGIEAFSVAQNVPNPFNPTTTINFTISKDDFVTLDIYNVAGQKVDTLVNDFKSAGNYSVVWDSSGLSAGVYFYTVKAGGFAKTIKMTLLK